MGIGAKNELLTPYPLSPHHHNQHIVLWAGVGDEDWGSKKTVGK
jgi:hypothetical protein